MAPGRWKRPVSVLVVVLGGGGRVLVLERRAPPGWRQSVTGALAEGETPREAARRELAEETGLEAEPEPLGLVARYPIHPAWRGRYAPDVRENEEQAFVARVAGTPAPRLGPEHVGWAWLPAAEAAAVVSSPTDAAAIRRAAGLDKTEQNSQN